ncbi:MAG: Uncharacterised protein [Cellulomonadaceae bacterium TMED98]|nr:MAG: Uncharacterised protein [Cellulomonadaceae bacterium TMED98]
MIGEHPRRWCADGTKGSKGFVHHASHILGIPARGQVGEVKRVVHFIGPNIFGHALQWPDPRFGGQNSVRAVLGEDVVPPAVDLVHGILIPEGFLCVGRGVCQFVLRQIRQPRYFHQPVGDIDTESVHTTI